MTGAETITIPRLPDESARAYAARVEYCVMGPARSQEAVSQKLAKSRQIISRWSSRFNWIEHAARYDDQVHYLTIQDAATKYRADLEAHRKKAMDAGQALYGVAGRLIQQVNNALSNPRHIKGEDGKVYTLHGIDLNANTFQIAARAMQTALDLEAHALGLEKLLPSLITDDSK